MSKKGYLYRVENFQIVTYEYVCVHPNNPNYHILLNNWTQEPVRFYGEIFEKLLTSREDAEVNLKNKLLRRIEMLGA